MHHFSFTDLDAAGKPRSGIARGNLAWFGSYSGCLALSDAKYCISTITVKYPPYNIVCIKNCKFLCFELNHNDAQYFPTEE